LAQAHAWAELAPDELRRRAVAAAASHDADALAGLADAYLTLRGRQGVHSSAHTRRAYIYGIRVLVAAWRSENLLRPHREASRLWLRDLEAAGAGPSTARVRLAAARLLYRALRWAGATEVDPFPDLRAAPETTAAWDKRAPYRPEDIAALLNAAPNSHPLADPALAARDHLMVLLGAHGGLRMAEACALTWADISLETATLRVRNGKGGKSRQVALSRSLSASLAAASREPAERLLPISQVQARERLAALCRRAGVPYRGYHALRHAAGTRAAKDGLGLEGIATFLGHASVETTRVYQHWADEQVRATISAW
jgi:integrase